MDGSNVLDGEQFNVLNRGCTKPYVAYYEIIYFSYHTSHDFYQPLSFFLLMMHVHTEVTGSSVLKKRLEQLLCECHFAISKYKRGSCVCMVCAFGRHINGSGHMLVRVLRGQCCLTCHPAASGGLKT